MNSVNQILHAHALATLSCKPAAVLDSTKMKIDTIVLNYFTIVPIRTTILQSSKRREKEGICKMIISAMSMLNTY